MNYTGRFEVLAFGIIKSAMFWVVTPSNLIEVTDTSRETSMRLHHHIPDDNTTIITSNLTHLFNKQTDSEPKEYFITLWLKYSYLRQSTSLVLAKYIK